MCPSRRNVLACGLGVTLTASSGCVGLLEPTGQDSSESTPTPTETPSGVERFRVVVEYEGSWRGDIWYTEDGGTYVRVPFARSADDPDRIAIEIPDDLQDPDSVGTIGRPLGFMTTSISGPSGASEDRPFVATLYVEGEQVDSTTITEPGRDATVEY